MENSLVLGGNHNGINCIQKTDAERPCDKIWFTAKQIEEALNVNKRTLNRHIDMLEATGDLLSGTNMTQTNLPDSRGSLHEATIYNLDAFNKICMTFIDNEVCQQVRQKFSDILSEVETTGSYGIQQKVLPNDYLTALKALVAAEEEKQQLALENKFITEQKELAEQQRDEAIRTKSYISDKKTATALGRVGGLVKENNYLKETLALAGEYRTILAVAQKNNLRDWHYISWRKLKRYCIEHNLVIKEISDVRFGTVKTYPIEAFKAIYPELNI